MRLRSLAAVLLLSGPVAAWADQGAITKGTKQDCQRGCNKRCSGAANKAKCVGQCRRACR